VIKGLEQHIAEYSNVKQSMKSVRKRKHNIREEVKCFVQNAAQREQMEARFARTAEIDFPTLQTRLELGHQMLHTVKPEETKDTACHTRKIEQAA